MGDSSADEGEVSEVVLPSSLLSTGECSSLAPLLFSVGDDAVVPASSALDAIPDNDNDNDNEEKEEDAAALAGSSRATSRELELAEIRRLEPVRRVHELFREPGLLDNEAPPLSSSC